MQLAYNFTLSAKVKRWTEVFFWSYTRCLEERLFKVHRRIKWTRNERGAECSGRRCRLLVASIPAFQLRACNRVQTLWDAIHYQLINRPMCVCAREFKCLASNLRSRAARYRAP